MAVFSYLCPPSKCKQMPFGIPHHKPTSKNSREFQTNTQISNSLRTNCLRHRVSIVAIISYAYYNSPEQPWHFRNCSVLATINIHP